MTFSVRSNQNNVHRFWSAHLLQLLTVGAGLWTAGVFLYPIAIHAHSFGAPALASRYMYSLVCHQIPERSLTLFGVPLSVCSRCTAIYLTFTLFMFVAVFQAKRPTTTLLRWIGPALILPMLVDVALDMLGFTQASLVSRVITGSLAGAGFALFLAPELIEYQHSIIPHAYPSSSAGESND